MLLNLFWRYYVYVQFVIYYAEISRQTPKPGFLMLVKSLCTGTFTPSVRLSLLLPTTVYSHRTSPRFSSMVGTHTSLSIVFLTPHISPVFFFLSPGLGEKTKKPRVFKVQKKEKKKKKKKLELYFVPLLHSSLITKTYLSWWDMLEFVVIRDNLKHKTNSFRQSYWKKILEKAFVKFYRSH